MLKTIKSVVSLFILITFLSCFAFADDNFDGYIVRLNESAISNIKGAFLFDDKPLTIEDAVENVVSTVSNVKELYAPQGLLKVDDINIVKYLQELGIVENYDMNVNCELYGYAPELNPYYTQQWALDAINAQYAWDSGFYGNDVRVAVIDSGVYPHVELSHCLVTGYNFVDGNTDTTDTNGHGTFISGVIAAQCNNIGIAGLSHRATIVPFKVTDGSSVPIERVINAIYAAVDSYDCDVLNLSLGTQAVVDELYNAVNYAISKGVLVVAAAGNISENTPLAPCYPAAYTEVISVANVKKVETEGVISYQVSDSSQYQSNVDIAAPGTGLISLAPSATSYASGSGTSFATPYVSAVAAIAKSINSDIDNTSFSYLISKSADDSFITSSGQTVDHWGSGLLDVGSFIQWAYLRFPQTHYLSKIDVQPYGNNTSVYIHNPNSTLKTYTLVLTSVNTTSNIRYFNSVRIIPVSLDAYQTYEASFTELGLSGQFTAMVFDDLGTLVPLGSARKN